MKKFLAFVILFIFLERSIEADDKAIVRYVSLTVGVTHDEKLPNVPSDPKFAGDYNKITGVSYAQELKTIRFAPRTEGVATLNILDPRGFKIYEIHVDVKKSNLNKVAREMQALLGDIEGISIKIVNNKVVVDG